jgi:hypothetical protein
MQNSAHPLFICFFDKIYPFKKIRAAGHPSSFCFPDKISLSRKKTAGDIPAAAALQLYCRCICNTPEKLIS